MKLYPAYLNGRLMQVSVPDAAPEAPAPVQPLRMQLTWQVLEMAKRHDDQAMIAACRRIINANRIGWRKHGKRSDLIAVLDYANSIQR